tara:strand:- start:3786 stop:4097 length:312 start_codon:yes stop_codon:yes gene_type:complete
MFYKFKIIRKVKRVITWFFGEETETIYCRNIDEVNEILEEDDKVFILSSSSGIQGVYEPYTAKDEAIRLIDECKKMNKNYNNAEAYEYNIQQIIKHLDNSNWN